MESGSEKRVATVGNPDGLHMRPLKEIARTAAEFESEIFIQFADRKANAKSMLELMVLVAKQGVEVTVTAAGADAKAAVEKICELVESPDI